MTESTEAVDSEWSWPGSRWWRCDLHVHSPSSYDYSGSEIADLLTSATDAGLAAIAITDHNAAGLTPELAELAAQLAPDLIVFPGVEVTSNEGAHLIVLFEPGSDSDRVKEYLTSVGTSSETWGKHEALAKEAFESCVEKAATLRAISIAAHADRPASPGALPMS